MAHRPNTNKQFMVGSDTPTFAVVFIVVIFAYMSLKLRQEKEAVRHFSETYSIQLAEDFVGDSISLFVNDSLIIDKQIKEEPTAAEVGRFAEQSALMIVNNQTETVVIFDLSEKGDTYRFERDIDGIKQLPQK